MESGRGRGNDASTGADKKSGTRTIFDFSLSTASNSSVSRWPADHYHLQCEFALPGVKKWSLFANLGTASPTVPSSQNDDDDPFGNFDNVPLFMKSLPKELGGTADLKPLKEGETNPANTLAALQALAYEGDPSGTHTASPPRNASDKSAQQLSVSPAEIAEGFRQQGNDLFKRKKFRDAIGFYSRALDEVGKDLSIEERRGLWGNRAAANLELGAFNGRVLSGRS